MRISLIASVGLMACCLTISSSPLCGQTFTQDLIDGAIDHDLVGMAVIVACEGQTVDEFYFGQAVLAANRQVTDSTLFRVASISKMVTATALMLLYEQGLFGLDDDVSDYLGFELQHPNFPAQAVTFRSLLSHTSGLRDGNGYFNFLNATFATAPPPPIGELLIPGGDYYTTDLWGAQPPGAYFTYSNLNYGVIGTLIEALSGQRFDQFVREELLLPLGMTGSFNVLDLPNIDNVSVLYRNGLPQIDNYQGVPPDPLDLSGYVPGSNGLIFGPQGSLRASARDLMAFLQLHLQLGWVGGVQLLDTATVQLMHSPQWTYNGANGDNYYNLFNSWGLGVHRTTNAAGGDIVLDGFQCFGHPGEAYGLISDLYFAKDPALGIVFLTNGYFGAEGYSFGDHSAFYTAEESVFSAVQEHLLPTCAPFSATKEAPVSPLLAIRPNPVASEFYVETGEAGFSHALVLSATGSLIWEKAEAFAGVLEIEVSSWPPGVYWLQLRGLQQVAWAKVVVER